MVAKFGEIEKFNGKIMWQNWKILMEIGKYKDLMK